MTHKFSIKDFFSGKEIEDGHIVAVRYAWNSYCGIARPQGLSLHEGAERFAGMAPFHPWESDKTYQVLGHISQQHPDYNEQVSNWHKAEDGDCPVKIRVYENMPEYPAKTIAG